MTILFNTAFASSTCGQPRYWRSLLMAAVLLAISGQHFISEAHSPHDVIDEMVLSPNYPNDKTVFITSGEALRRSTDGGHAWRDIVWGLDNRYDLTSLAISPDYRIDRTVMVSSNGDGIYRSTDGGTSWHKVNTGLRDRHIARLFWPRQSPHHMLLAVDVEGNLYRTMDRGNSWVPLQTNMTPNAMAVIPADPTGHLVAGDAEGRLLRSPDAGATWHVLKQHPEWGAVNSIAVLHGSASNPTLLIGTAAAGVWQIDTRGNVVGTAGSGMPPDAHVRWLETISATPKGPTVFATTWRQAAFRSADGGVSWEKWSAGLTTDNQADDPHYHSPHFRQICAVSNFNVDPTLFVAGFDGLFKSTDGGRHWTQMETMTIGRIMDLAVSPTQKSEYAVLISTYGGGAYLIRSDAPEWEIMNQGLPRTRLSGVAFAPNGQDAPILFAGIQGSLVKAADQRPWQTISADPGGWMRFKSKVLQKLHRIGLPAWATVDLLADYERSVPYPTVLTVSPDYANDGTLFFGTRRHGLMQALQKGDRIKFVKPEFGLVTSLAISPDYQIDRILFAAPRAKGIYRSSDAGRTWREVNEGLNIISEWAQAAAAGEIDPQEMFDRRFYDIHLAVSPDFAKDRTVFAATGGGLFRSRDAGINWKRRPITVSKEKKHLLTLTVSPDYATDQTLLVSATGRGLFKSTDGGESFTPIGRSLLKSNYAVYHIRFSPYYAADRTIFASAEEALFKSTNAGQTWQLIERPIRYEDHRDVIDYQGPWVTIRQDRFSAKRASWGKASGSRIIFRFVGTGVRIMGARSKHLGSGLVHLDGRPMGYINQFHPKIDEPAISWQTHGLAYGPHILRVETISPKDDPTQTGILIDAFDVFGHDHQLD